MAAPLSQLMEKVLFDERGEDASVPDTAPPVENPGPAVATQLATLEEFQERVVGLPELTGLGLAEREQVGVPAGQFAGTVIDAEAFIPL